MSLFRSSLRPPAVLSDEAVERYLAAVRATLDPDPGFRRRLRGHVLNHYVASREGIGPRPLAREMGRLGRAVLYATFALAVSVTGAMAASQGSIPGDVLYPLKLQIEDLRMQALADEFHDELAAHELAERIVELDRLAESGSPAAVARQVQAVEAAYATFVAAGGESDETADRLAAIEELIAHLPEQAQDAVSNALGNLPGVGAGANAGTPGQGRDQGGVPPGQSRGGGPGDRPASSARPQPTPEPTPAPSAEPTPRPTPKPQPTKPPQASEQPTPKPKPTKSVTPTPAGQASSASGAQPSPSP